ncbi:helix-turn-helix transcriptional regulator [Pigmentibacter sp. JX0631]|uniref:helix-turn-helix domain-containing protein n=1 Tax=Pigmentibacter sp. JX0631 TaxID=2976982 RepID=UPI002468AE9F|nr:helix-turn-helix transcriptional regulator [Pigmentibacter sp. JX0631]WGL61303.1 helix-turn-helix transcriptional regulator [Pigmentibacter sp. JX0631]
MEIQFKRKNPFEVLGLPEGEVSLLKIEEAYRNKRKQLEEAEKNSQNTQLLYDEVEKAFQELVNYLDDDNSLDQEEVVISATLFPKKTHQTLRNNNPPESSSSEFDDDYTPIYNQIIEKKSNLVNKTHSIKPVESIFNAKIPIQSKNIKAEATKNHLLLNSIQEMLRNKNNINGLFLKNIREKMDVSIDEMSLKIKVSKNYLEAIETDHFENLPAEVYAKGFFSSYLSYLGIEKKELVEALIEIYRNKKRLMKKK